jgi:hypothetical protein
MNCSWTDPAGIGVPEFSGRSLHCPSKKGLSPASNHASRARGRLRTSKSASKMILRGVSLQSSLSINRRYVRSPPLQQEWVAR